jgi:hypothetical protein
VRPSVRSLVLRELEEGRYAWFALAWAMVAAALLIWIEGSGQTFFADEWHILFARPAALGSDELFAPANGQFILLPLLVYKGLATTAGVDSYEAWRVLSIGLNLFCATLLFLVLRRRVPPWLAVGSAALMMVFGAGWEYVMSPLGITPYIAIAAGLGVMLALDRRDPPGDVTACVLLIVGVISFGTTMAFLVGAAVSLYLRPGQAWQRAWVWAVPLALYAVWTVWALKYDQNPAAVSHIANVPSIVFNSISAVLAALVGLFRIPGGGELSFRLEPGMPLAFMLIGLVSWRLARPSPERGSIWVAILIALSFWTMLALAFNPPYRGLPESSRYLYPGALFVLLLGAELIRGVRLSPAAWVICGLVFVSTLIANIAHLHDASRFLARNSDFVRAELTALELARDRVDPGFRPQAPELLAREGHPNTLGFLKARHYFPVRDDHGSPAYGPKQLPGRPAQVRRVVDIVLASALELRLTPAARPPGGPVNRSISAGSPREVSLSRRECIALRPDPGMASRSIVVPTGGVVIAASQGPRVRVRVRRFSDGFDVPVGRVPGGGVAKLAIPTDAGPNPWLAGITASQTVRVCGTAR